MDTYKSFDNTKLAYTDTGGEGEAIILLHGFTGSSKLNWVDTGVYYALRMSGRRVIMLDARGHGNSEKPHNSYSYWNRAMAKDINSLGEHLRLYEYDLMGYSMGAKTAVEAELMYAGIRSLILIGFSIYEEGWTLESEEREARIRNMIEEYPAEPDAFRISADETGGDREAFAARIEGAIFPEFTWDNLRKIHLPVLIINGENDYSAQEAASYFPSAKGVTVEGDHLGVLSSERLSEEVLLFLDLFEGEVS
jgi:pimeloyl-ACP methyl ester carboxylesterase